MASIDTETLESIDVVYDTVLDASRWRDAIDREAGLAGAHGSMLFCREPGQTGLDIIVMSNGFDESAGEFHLETLASADALRWDGLLEEVPALTVLPDTEIWPDREQLRAMPSTRWLRDRGPTTVSGSAPLGGQEPSSCSRNRADSARRSS